MIGRSLRIVRGLRPLLLAGALAPLWAVAASAATGELTLVDGQLSCPGHDCTIALKPGETLVERPGGAYRVFELLDSTEPGEKHDNGDNGDDDENGGGNGNGEHTRVVRYYFLSSDIVDIPAYSGKPIKILIGLSPAGIIDDTRLISHKEPILLVGIPESTLTNLVAFYRGKNVRDKIKVGATEPGYIKVDIITGATVTAIVADETIMSAARSVAVDLGILSREAAGGATLTDEFEPKNWKLLLEMGAIGSMTISQQDMGAPPGEQPWLQLYFADLSHPTIGRNLLGDDTYTWLLSELKPGQTAMWIGGYGTWGFKGSGFARGGIFDRFQIQQGLHSFMFRDRDYKPVYTFVPEDAPDIREQGIFFLRDGLFEMTSPWEIVVLGSRLTGETAVSKEFHTFRAAYRIPADLLHLPQSKLAGIWQANAWKIGWYIALWLFVVGCFVFRKKLAANLHVLEWTQFAVWIAAIITLGVVIGGQPSVVNIFTLLDVTRHNGSFELFFTEPFLAVGWIFITITVIVWGRPFFCGWVCPYGALQSVLYTLRTNFTPWKKSVEFPARVRAFFKPVRYMIFLGLLSVSLVSLEWAEVLAEIEPFKTTWTIGAWNRPLAFGLYTTLLLSVALFMDRFFCRFLCPLGAALSLASFIPKLPLVPIPRRNFCTRCVKCAKGCSTHAINEKGEINARECLGCHECVNKMYDVSACPPLVSEKTWKEFESGPWRYQIREKYVAPDQSSNP